MSSKSTHERPRKLQRISQACDLCNRRSPSAEEPRKCQNCYDFAVDCTYNRPSRRRRNPSASQAAPGNILPSQQQRATQSGSPAIKLENGHQHLALPLPSADFTGAYEVVREGRRDDLLSVAWHCFAASNQQTIDRYLEIYMEVVYPLFPFFHGPTLWDRVRKRHHLKDRGFFASVMAACALAAARTRDGALDDKYQIEERLGNSSEVFFSAAQDNISKDLTHATGLGYLRACALLALTAIQYGQVQTMHLHMGHYMTLATIQRFHDEAHWPEDISVQEREERRRLFWAMYSFDVYTSVVFNTTPKSQETHSYVAYPCETTDDELAGGVTVEQDPENWLRGFNFTTDLYRVLEHAMKRVRLSQCRRDDRISVVRLMMANTMPDTQIMENVINLYYSLPDRFKNYTAPATGDRSQDIYGFQAANIQATLQLVRITLLESRTSSLQNVEEKCRVADTVLQTFRDIPRQYLRAISTPLVYHLGGIGHILSAVMQGILNEESYQRVRTLMVQLADLLEDLETGLQPAAGSSRGLRKRIDKIDQYIQTQRQMLSEPPRQHMTPYAHSVDGAHTHYVPSNGPNGPTHAVLSHGGHHQITNNMGMRTPHDEFQLPAEITTGGWPWPFDLTPDGAHHVPTNGVPSNGHAT
ncbi:hypothetical protein CERZMDRAFT_93884 [Cercospora zeae-maydis SCOH1-5]|uniref:Xylanolytic transcriptional activator regulatory domain-containing protein n=1 Tax=Cercospora zeae-maydis SCOH1-5 TaxID=717836 RepID=A0A6A6FSX8_9PEZI|nr:hypothetical protein CERZMDRAFT_93884 [Cercospora zeae-maydis SCOH1-5]